MPHETPMLTQPKEKELQINQYYSAEMCSFPQIADLLIGMRCVYSKIMKSPKSLSCSTSIYWVYSFPTQLEECQHCSGLQHWREKSILQII